MRFDITLTRTLADHPSSCEPRIVWGTTVHHARLRIRHRIRVQRWATTCSAGQHMLESAARGRWNLRLGLHHHSARCSTPVYLRCSLRVPATAADRLSDRAPYFTARLNQSQLTHPCPLRSDPQWLIRIPQRRRRLRLHRQNILRFSEDRQMLEGCTARAGCDECWRRSLERDSVVFKRAEEFHLVSRLTCDGGLRRECGQHAQETAECVPKARLLSPA